MPSHIIHPIPPVFDADSRILILGSFPSVKSRESCFFYGHPQNRFWKLLTRLRKEDIPSSVEEKKAFLLRNHIAVWDTIAVAQGLSVYAVFAFICILWAYYQRSPFRFYTILHRFRLSVNMQMNRIRFCLHIPHNTNVFRCRLCSNHNTVPMIRLALK